MRTRRILLCLAVVVSCGESWQSSASIEVDPQQRFQTIDGFGVNFDAVYFRESQKPMIDMLVKDLRATIFRLDPYGLTDWEARNDDDDPNHMNVEYYNDRYSTGYFDPSWRAAQYLNSLGIRPFLTLSGITPEWMNDNAPPPAHKVCRSLEDIQRRGYNKPYHLNAAMYDEFAETVVSLLVYARDKAHIDFEYFSPFNETDCFPAEGPRIDPEEAPRVLNAIVRLMKKEALDGVRLVVADQANAANDYASPILQDEALMKQVAVLSLHSYGDTAGLIRQNVERVLKSKHPNTRIWLTEYGDLGVFDRSPEAEWKRQCLAATRRALRAINEGAQAALFWDAFDNYHEHDRRIFYHGLFRNDDHHYSPKKRYYAAKQLYRFVAPGSQRIRVSADVPGLLLSAFRNGPDASLVVVGVKEGGPNRLKLVLPETANGPRKWEIYATTHDVNCLKLDDAPIKHGSAEFMLPDEAVFTAVASLRATEQER